MKTPDMTIDRAKDINRRIVYAYLGFTRTIDCEIPDLSNVTFAEAIAATEMMTGYRERNADGSTTVYGVVESTRLPAMSHLFRVEESE